MGWKKVKNSAYVNSENSQQEPDETLQSNDSAEQTRFTHQWELWNIWKWSFWSKMTIQIKSSLFWSKKANVRRIANISMVQIPSITFPHFSMFPRSGVSCDYLVSSNKRIIFVNITFFWTKFMLYELQLRAITKARLGWLIQKRHIASFSWMPC